MTRAEHKEMKNLCRIAKYFNMSWSEIEIISYKENLMRFKIDKNCVFDASLDEKGLLQTKTIKQDNIANY